MYTLNKFSTKSPKRFEDTSESIGYFEFILQNEHKDLLLESLALGNLGLCKQKTGDYDTAIDTFKKQLTLLAKRLDASSHSASTSAFDYTTQQLRVNKANAGLVKELISIRIDMARSFAQLSKSYELMSLQAKKTTTTNCLYIDNAETSDQSDELRAESFTYLNEYYKECDYLYELFGRPLLNQIETSKTRKQTDNKNESDSLEDENEDDDDDSNEMDTGEIHHLTKELSEHIFIDYDHSLAKLSHFYAVYGENDGYELFDVSVNNPILSLLNLL